MINLTLQYLFSQVERKPCLSLSLSLSLSLFLYDSLSLSIPFSFSFYRPLKDSYLLYLKMNLAEGLRGMLFRYHIALMLSVSQSSLMLSPSFTSISVASIAEPSNRDSYPIVTLVTLQVILVILVSGVARVCAARGGP